MTKKALWVQTALFLAFIGIFFIVNLLTPDKQFSEQENRALQTAPQFSFASLFSGKYTSTFETYITDQFTLRDSWTSLKARTELLSGKDENNGVFLCENETLIETFDKPDYSELDFSLDAVKALADASDVPVYFALIPTASDIWRDKLPENAPNSSERDVIDYAYSKSGAENIDVYSALSAHSAEDIYYRTDHHWTTLGAYYGYEAIVSAMGIEPKPLTDYTKTLATDSFFGTTYSSSGFSWVRPDSIYTYVEQDGAEITNYPQGAPVEGTLYDESFLAAKDKYSYFYGGNTPLLTIKTENTDAPTLLIVRDSYMDSMSPYLLADFSEISIVDLRYYKTSLKSLIESSGADNILVCYSVANFSTDGNIFLISR